MTRPADKLLLAAVLGVALTTSGCFLQQRGQQRELPPREEPRQSANEIPADVANIPDAVPRDEPLSQYGNPESYTVYGETYQVLPTAQGYNERGYASWYGRKFHGRRTSSGEIYDMYQMTAAHRTLPLPTFVKVRNLENNRVITVRVNDRGPFHSDRIIDLSYAAAAKLGILDAGSAMVQVEAINPGGRIIAQNQSPPTAPPPTAPQQSGNYPQASGGTPPPGSYPQGPSVTGGGFDSSVPEPTPVPVPAPPPASPPPVASAPPAGGSIYDQPPSDSFEVPSEPDPASIYDTPVSIYDTPDTSYNTPDSVYTEPQYSPPPDQGYAPPPTAYAPPYDSGGAMSPGTYLQAGAYSQSTNARAMADRLRNAGFNNVVVNSGDGDGLSRVHVGPYSSDASLQNDKRRLNVMGISAFTVRR